MWLLDRTPLSLSLLRKFITVPTSSHNFPIPENGIRQLSTSGRRAVVQHVVSELIGYQIQKKLVFFELCLEPSSQRKMSTGAGEKENGWSYKVRDDQEFYYRDTEHSHTYIRFIIKPFDNETEIFRILDIWDWLSSPLIIKLFERFDW